MSFEELSRERFSVRKYKSVPVEEAKSARILEAMRVAPTACNNQPQRVKVITAAADLAKIDECTSCRFGASLVYLICYDEAACWTREYDGVKSGVADASIVTTHMMLAARELGLGSVWVMWFDAAKAKTLFNLAPGIVPVAILPVGYAADDAVPAPQHGSRKDIGELLL